MAGGVGHEVTNELLLAYGCGNQQTFVVSATSCSGSLTIVPTCPQPVHESLQDLGPFLVTSGMDLGIRLLLVLDFASLSQFAILDQYK